MHTMNAKKTGFHAARKNTAEKQPDFCLTVSFSTWYHTLNQISTINAKTETSVSRSCLKRAGGWCKPAAEGYAHHSRAAGLNRVFP